jgi:hypothetical protein
MVEHARRRGYAYQVLTDHSQSLAIARGLTPDRSPSCRDHRRAQRSVRCRGDAGTAPPETPAEGLSAAPRLRGSRVRADGVLDFEDDLLASFDVVVASVHVGRRQPKADLTRRTLNASAARTSTSSLTRPGARSASATTSTSTGTRSTRRRPDRDRARDERLAAAARPRRRACRRAVSDGCMLSIDAARTTSRSSTTCAGGSARLVGLGPPAGRRQHAVAPRTSWPWDAAKPERVCDTRTIAAMDDRFGQGRPCARRCDDRRACSRLLEPPAIWLVARPS